MKLAPATGRQERDAGRCGALPAGGPREGLGCTGGLARSASPRRSPRRNPFGELGAARAPPKHRCHHGMLRAARRALVRCLSPRAESPCLPSVPGQGCQTSRSRRRAGQRGGRGRRRCRPGFGERACSGERGLMASVRWQGGQGCLERSREVSRRGRWLERSLGHASSRSGSASRRFPQQTSSIGSTGESSGWISLQAERQRGSPPIT